MDPVAAAALRCPVYAPFFGAMGCAIAVVLCGFGASYGTAKSSVAIFSSGVIRPDRMVQNTLAPIMAGILSIYGLVASVMISNGLVEKMPVFTGFMQLGAGIAVGMSGMAAGFSIGIVGDAGIRASSQQPRLFTGMVLILIMAEVLGLYGMIVSIMMLTQSRAGVTECVY